MAGSALRRERSPSARRGRCRRADTTTVSVMDEEGNAIAITHTLGSPCSGVVVEGLGFLFNNSMHIFHPFPGHPNSIAPGKARTTACLLPSSSRTAGRFWWSALPAW